MALIIAGERSGVGKTTITLAILAYLSAGSVHEKKATVQSFKVGPDYIDPMFHQYVTKRPCYNLDPILTSEKYVQQCFLQRCQGADYAVVEGVMGLFDGASGTTDIASTAHIARLLNLPILLVVDCSRLSRSAAAIVHGYCTFDPRIQLAGVILNRVGSDRHLHLLKTALEPLNVPILGVLRRETNITIPDRHLGLIPTDELPMLDSVVERLQAIATTCFDWENLLSLLKSSSSVNSLVNSPDNKRVTHSSTASFSPTISQPNVSPPRDSCAPLLRIAIALDQAFNFYYADNLDILRHLGATLVFWSPMHDHGLPENIHGLYLGGGFPEVFGAELAANHAARRSIKQSIEEGLPTYAECGGLMYLCEALVDFDAQVHTMVGVLPTTVRMGKKLALGYRKAIAQTSSSLVFSGQTLWGHEFHHSQLDRFPAMPLYQLQGYKSSWGASDEGWTYRNLHASYLHVHWGTSPELPKRFLSGCQARVG